MFITYYLFTYIFNLILFSYTYSILIYLTLLLFSNLFCKKYTTFLLFFVVSVD